MNNKLILVFILIFSGFSSETMAHNTYPWLENYAKNRALVNQISVPSGFERISVANDSFASWLRYLPLKSGKPLVYLYNQVQKNNQSAHHAVIDLDVGSRDLQQCADAIIRLRAEYLYSKGDYKRIHFNFTSGDEASYPKWRKGYRPIVRNNAVKWRKTQDYDQSYRTFRKYTNTVFIYAGSYSLSQELKTVKSIHEMKIGDVFIRGGFPGHAVIVVDMARHKATGAKIFLLAQSYMPAQDMHILINPLDQNLTPWYPLKFGQKLYTPEWVFKDEELKRF
jgi:hypothetical protein